MIHGMTSAIAADTSDGMNQCMRSGESSKPRFAASTASPKFKTRKHRVSNRRSCSSGSIRSRSGRSTPICQKSTIPNAPCRLARAIARKPSGSSFHSAANLSPSARPIGQMMFEVSARSPSLSSSCGGGAAFKRLDMRLGLTACCLLSTPNVGLSPRTMVCASA